MNLTIKEKTATKVYDGSGNVTGEKVASIMYRVMDDANETELGNVSLTATGLNINMYSGLGEDLAKWETNINAAFAALNQEV